MVLITRPQSIAWSRVAVERYSGLAGGGDEPAEPVELDELVEPAEPAKPAEPVEPGEPGETGTLPGVFGQDLAAVAATAC